MKFLVTKTSDSGRNAYEKEIGNLEALLKFQSETDESFIITTDGDNMPQIEIYDYYRE